MTVDSIKERIVLFEQFDHTLNKLFEEIDNFNKESRVVIRKETDSIKLYGLAFNLAWTLRNSIDVCKRYETAIKNSLLYDRFEVNNKNSEEFEYVASDVVPFIENIIESLCISTDLNANTDFFDEEEKEKILSDNEYLIKLSEDLTRNGNKILRLLCFYMRQISKILYNTKTNRVNMSDNDYRFLFEREFNEYLRTDEWNDLKNTFIERTIINYYYGQEPTKEQLRELCASEVEKIECMSESFGIIEPYLEDYPKLSRMIVRRELKNEINSPVLELFLHLGRKLLIVKWKQQLEEEDLCYIPEDDGEKEVTYSEHYSEAICKRTMPQILKLYENRDAMDWVCFYHVLVFYSYIACDDFNVFNRWLTQVAGKELISVGNARKIKMSYWAREAKKQWTKEGALNETDTPQQETKYRNYTLLCEEIREIINEAKK